MPSKNKCTRLTNPHDKYPSADEVRIMPYVSLLARLKESNRPPGGIDTIRQMLINCHLRPGMQVLHAGCNAGFLSRELARRSGCSVLGVDISEAMVTAANERATSEGISHLVSHERQDMRALDIGDGRFDVVMSGGALAFVDGKEAAVEEWIRVTLDFGLVADAEFYYRKKTPEKIRTAIANAIGVAVPQYDKQHWLALFKSSLLEPYYQHDSIVITRDKAEILDYSERMVMHSASNWGESAKAALAERLFRLFTLFNQNLRYMSYVILIYRRLPKESEPSLFV